MKINRWVLALGLFSLVYGASDVSAATASKATIKKAKNILNQIIDNPSIDFCTLQANDFFSYPAKHNIVNTYVKIRDKAYKAQKLFAGGVDSELFQKLSPIADLALSEARSARDKSSNDIVFFETCEKTAEVIDELDQLIAEE